MVFVFTVCIEEDLEDLEDCTCECEDGSLLFGCNALGASLGLPPGRDAVTVGGDGVIDLDAFEDELDMF